MMMLQFVIDAPEPPAPLPVSRPATRPVQPQPEAAVEAPQVTVTDIPSSNARSERATKPYSAIMVAAVEQSRQRSERPERVTRPHFAAVAVEACRITRPSIQAVAIQAQRSSRRVALAAAFLLAVLTLLTISLAPAWARAQSFFGPDGQLDEELLARTALAHRAEVEQCYDRALVDAPDLSGRMVVDLRVGPYGSVLAAGVRHATFDAPELQACVLDQVERWSFPTRYGPPVRVLVPFEFEKAAPSPAAGQTFAISVGTSAFRVRLREHPGVQACYDDALLRDHTRGGELTVLFSIDPEGVVTVVEPVSSTLGDDIMESCVLDSILDVTLPSFPGKGSTEMQTTLRFSSSEW